MVDRLKKSLEELEPPVCEKCDVEMKWYRSEIQIRAPNMVDHHFFCSNCGGTRTRATELRTKSSDDKPDRLSLPFSQGLGAETREAA